MPLQCSRMSGVGVAAMASATPVVRVKWLEGKPKGKKGNLKQEDPVDPNEAIVYRHSTGNGLLFSLDASTDVPLGARIVSPSSRFALPFALPFALSLARSCCQPATHCAPPCAFAGPSAPTQPCPHSAAARPPSRRERGVRSSDNNVKGPVDQARIIFATLA